MCTGGRVLEGYGGHDHVCNYCQSVVAVFVPEPDCIWSGSCLLCDVRIATGFDIRKLIEKGHL